MSKPVSCVRGRKHAVICHRHVCVHRRRQEFLWMNAEPVWHKNILWLHIQRHWQRYFVRTVSRVKHRISMKGEAAFWKQALPRWTWEAALQVTAKTEPSTTSASERETGGLAACVCVSQLVCLFYFLVCFLRVLRGGVMERGVLSVLYTKKIKLLMAWISSNGTLSWVCVFYVCVCINKAAFKASLIHGCITAFRSGLSLSFLFAAPSLCPYMWASCAFCFQAAELRPSAPCVPMKDPLCFCGVPAPHPTSITPNHCCEGEHSLIFLLMWEHFTCRRTCY